MDPPPGSASTAAELREKLNPNSDILSQSTQCFDDFATDISPPLLAGAIFGAAWWLWFDAVLYHTTNQYTPTITSNHWFPGILATFAAFLLTVAPARALSGHTFSPPNQLGSAECVRFYVFFTALIAFAAILNALWFLVYTFAPPDKPITHPWPGIAMTIQTATIFASSLLTLYSRIPAD